MCQSIGNYAAIVLVCIMGGILLLSFVGVAVQEIRARKRAARRRER